MKSKRMYLTAPRTFEMREDDLSPGTGEILVRVKVCGLCNWELNHYKGIIADYPKVIGHELAGEVVQTGEGASKFKVGDRVVVLPDNLGGFSELLVAPEEICFKLNDDVDITWALGEPLKCIITVVHAARVQAGDTGVVVGCGPMGLWTIQALKGNTLSKLVAIDVDNSKLELAKKNGATHCINPKECNAADELSKITDGRMADFVIEGTGIPSLLESALDYLKRSGRGRLVVMSSHESVTKEFDFRKAHVKGIDMSFPFPVYSDDQLDDMRIAVDYINNKVFDMSDIISHTFTLDTLDKAFEALENKPAGYKKGIVLI